MVGDLSVYQNNYILSDFFLLQPSLSFTLNHYSHIFAVLLDLAIRQQ